MAKVLLRDNVTEIACDTATEFLTVLDPLLGPFSQPNHLGMYIFRGVSSAQYGLRPTAFRPKSVLYAGAEWVHPPLPTVGQQCEAEIATLQKFFEIAARNGIQLPEDSQFLRSELDAWSGRFYFATSETPVFWPPSNLLSLIALAQHHGVPTRALDWTWSSLTAAYFAASNADVESDDHVAVWIFSYFAEMLDRIPSSDKKERRPLTIFTAPGAENENLQAQRGLFMAYVHGVIDRDEPFVPVDYEVPLATIGSASRYFPNLYRVLVPSREAPRIRWFLSAAGVTAGRLFPGLWGVAREFREERLLSRETAGAPVTKFAAELQREIRRVYTSRGA